MHDISETLRKQGAFFAHHGRKNTAHDVRHSPRHNEHHEPEGPVGGDPFTDMGHDAYQQAHRIITDESRVQHQSEIHSFLLLYGLVTEQKYPWWADMPRWLRDAMRNQLPPEALTDLDREDSREELDQSTFSRAYIIFKHFCIFLAHTTSFQAFYLFVIFLNTIFMAFQVDSDWSQHTKDSLDSVFISLFLIEVIVRIMAHGSHHLYTHRGLLIFECILVFIAIVDKWIIPLLLATRHTIDFSTITVFRVFRMLQIVRMLQVITFLRPLRVMERAIARAVMYFFWNFLFMVSLAYICALGFRIYLIKIDTRQNFGFEMDYFGSTLYTLIYLLESVWHGMNWVDSLYEPLEEDSNTLICSWMLFATIFVMDLAISIMVEASFIENFLSSVRNEVQEVDRDILARKLDITGLFEILEACDEKGDGRVTLTELLLPLQDSNKARKHKFLRIFQLQRRPMEDKALHLKRCEGKLTAFFQNCDLGHEGSVKIDLIVWGYMKLCGASGTIDGILRDYQFRRLLRVLETPDKGVHMLSEHIDGMTHVVREQHQMVNHSRIEIEESLNPFEKSLVSLERRFEEVGQSLLWMNPDNTENQEIGPGAAGVASLKLRNEMDALKEAAYELLKQEEAPAPSQSPWWEMRGDNLLF